jgi:hypothetical protein
MMAVEVIVVAASLARCGRRCIDLGLGLDGTVVGLDLALGLGLDGTVVGLDLALGLGLHGTAVELGLVLGLDGLRFHLVLHLGLCCHGSFDGGRRQLLNEL